MSQWTFQPNSYWCGWDDSGLSTFAGQPRRSLIRELIQNSLDAKRENTETVTVRFELNSCARNMIPDVERLSKILERCVAASEDESDDSKESVADASEFLSERMNFPVLTCTDFGTSGMEGPYKKGSPFFTYMNSSGSSPGSAGRRGSHGHGKDAPLANSVVRTIFASSTYLDEEGTRRHLAGGKTVLMSHYQDDDEQFSNIGQWAAADKTPFSDLQSEYAWINPAPDELGTSISILGFDVKGIDWIHECIGHAVISYFPAFIRGLLKLEFKDGATKITLSQTNFLEYLGAKEVREALRTVDRGLVDELERTAFFASAMMVDRGGKTRDQEANSPLGLVDFHLLVEDGAPRAYCLIRENMKIAEKLPYLQRIPRKYKEFAAVIECQRKEANSLIRSMEPSEHDSVHVSRLKKDRQADGDKLWKYLKEKFFNVLDQEAMTEQKLAGQIDFLSKFFPDLAGEGDGLAFEDDEGWEGDRITIEPVETSRRKKKLKITLEEDDEDEEDDREDKEDKEDDKEDDTEDKEDKEEKEEKEEKKPSNKTLRGELRAQRVIAVDDRNVRLIVRLDQPRKCEVLLLEVGHDSAEPLPIVTSSLGVVLDGALQVDPTLFGSDGKITAELEVEREVKGAYLAQVREVAS